MDEYEDKYISAKELVNTMLEEAEKLPDDLPKDEGLAIATAAQYIRGYIKRVKSADVQPVKRGTWEQLVSRQSGLHYEVGAHCSCCNEHTVTLCICEVMPFEFCPHCGADMRGAENE
jgi:hypothetical protein